MAESWVVLGKLAKVTIRWRFWICGFWLACALVAALGAANFLSVTTLSFDAPQGSEAATANDVFAKSFPDSAITAEFAALLEVPTGRRVLDVEGLKDFSFSLRDKLNASGDLLTFQSNSTLWFEHQITSPGLVNANGNTSLIQWAIAGDPTSPNSLKFAKFAQQVFDQQVEQHLKGLSFYGLSAVPILCNVAVSDTEKSLAEMDAIAMPIAVLVLWAVIQSGRLLLLPLAAMGTAASLSFGIMYLVGLVTIVEQSTPSLMMSLLIAMSIDYSLFLLTRFREEVGLVIEQTSLGASGELEAGTAECDAYVQKVYQCVENTMQTAGFTVLLSGTTLILSFLVVALFPVMIVSSLGVGCAVSLFVTLVVHLTLVPAMLAAFPHFFGKAASPDRAGARAARRLRSCCCPTRGGFEARAALVEQAGAGATTRGLAYSACWVQLAKWTTTFPLNIVLLVVIVAGTVAAGVPILRTKISDDIMMSVPRGTDAYAAFQHQVNAFGMGSISPYKLMLRPLNGGSVLQKDFWESAQAVTQAMASQLPRTSPRDFQFLWFAGTSADPLVPWDGVDFCLQNPSTPLCAELFYGIDTFANADSTAGFGYITLSFDPFGNDGPRWLKAARALAASLGRQHGMEVALIGTAANGLDIISRVYSVFPYMVIGTLCLALVLLGLAFRSIVIPLRSVFSICLTLLAVYGFSALTYQDGILESIGMPGLTGAFKAQNWMIPVICFSIVVGICLDYDIFLLSRATEFREGGMSPIESIRLGLCSTGGIITAAGVVMAIAFGGLLFSSMLDINNLAFYMVVSVLYDTLIVRCLLAPAAMSILGRWNWWPSKLSKED